MEEVSDTYERATLSRFTRAMPARSIANGYLRRIKEKEERRVHDRCLFMYLALEIENVTS